MSKQEEVWAIFGAINQENMTIVLQPHIRHGNYTSIMHVIVILSENIHRFERCHLNFQSSIAEDQTISTQLIADSFSFCIEVCTLALDRRYEIQGSIGGPGIIVEIDECKIERRKFERGRLREGAWILGAFFMAIVILKVLK